MAILDADLLIERAQQLAPTICSAARRSRRCARSLTPAPPRSGCGRAPARFLAVEYRELVADPVRTTGTIVRWLGRAHRSDRRGALPPLLVAQPRHPRHEYNSPPWPRPRDLPAG